MSRPKRVHRVRVLVIAACAFLLLFVPVVYERVKLNRERFMNIGTPVVFDSSTPLAPLPKGIYLRSSRIEQPSSKLKQWWWEWSTAAKDLLTRRE